MPVLQATLSEQFKGKGQALPLLEFLNIGNTQNELLLNGILVPHDKKTKAALILEFMGQIGRGVPAPQEDLNAFSEDVIIDIHVNGDFEDVFVDSTITARDGEPNKSEQERIRNITSGPSGTIEYLKSLKRK